MKSAFHIIISLFFSLLIAVLVVQKNLSLFMGDIDDYKKATIYFKSSTLENEADQFVSEKIDKAESIKKISKEQALQDFKSTFGDFSQNLSDLDSITDLVPLSYEVTFSDEQDRKQFITNWSQHELVDEVIAVDKVFSRYTTLQRSLTTFVGILFAISFLICGFMTSLLVKSIIYGDRRQIEIYALFGESYESVVKSYFKNLLKYLLSTGVLSVLIVFTFYFAFKVKLQTMADLRFISDRLTFLSIQQIVFVLAGFGFAYFSGVYFVLKRMLLKSYNR